jgi:hypothetical protein
MSWFLNMLPSFGKPDQAKCSAKKQAEDEKNKKMIAEEDERHKKAMDDINASVECKPETAPVQQQTAPVQQPSTETPQMGGKRRKSKRERRNKKKNTKRRR